MQFTSLLAAAAAVAPVFGYIGVAPTGGSTVTALVTRTVTAYETYCPSSTKFTEGTKTYTATKEQWVTVTDCPNQCTITYNPSKPTVVPVANAPKWNNGTAPNRPWTNGTTPAECPCKKPDSTECPCQNPGVAPVPVPGNNGTTSTSNNGTLGTGNNGGNTQGSNTPGSNTPGSNTPSSNTPGSNTPGSNTPGSNGDNGNGSGPTISTGAASTFSTNSMALLGLAAIAVYAL